jgi:hypothetical protein
MYLMDTSENQALERMFNRHGPATVVAYMQLLCEEQGRKAEAKSLNECGTKLVIQEVYGKKVQA